MPSPGPNALAELGLRCSCGDPIDVITHRDNASRLLVLSLRCHDKRYDTQISDQELYGYSHSQADCVTHYARRGAHALANACPAMSPISFNSVTDSAYERIEYRLPNGQSEYRMCRRMRPAASTANQEWEAIQQENREQLSTIAHQKAELARLKAETEAQAAEIAELNKRNHMPAREGVRRLILN